MHFTEIQTAFENCQSWEERYRLLVQLSRQLPKLSEDQLSELPEIEGCESRLWFQFEAEPRQIFAFSDARLMQGILQIVQTLLLETPTEKLAELDLQGVFNQLKISQNLTQTRLNGLAEIQRIVQNAIRP
ncbi:hypothetical protein B0187_01770 [Haemophilus paracuniculus]|uniref:Fe-S metabolism associated domain-containing protein n=1 Tax=Haemophilus paracuniculus TaxID=734 RepID=A0A1T0AUQ7_9PAST|nr:SufE family protein [Haemophilus paracuniculus]OOS00238.1 hypothetical protein B0187_01770 [Haemophilus paracuniculus]